MLHFGTLNLWNDKHKSNMKQSWIPVTVLLISLGELIHARGPPVVMSQVTQRQIGRVGEKIRLSCPVEADPTPLLQWTKDGESINRGWERFKISSLSLRIKDAVVEDTGRYECKATNGFGHVTVDYVLIVLNANDSVPLTDDDIYKPSVPEPAGFMYPELMNGNLILKQVGTNLRLHCPAVGSPEPYIKWYKDGQYFDANHFLMSGGGFVDSSMEDYDDDDDWPEDVDNMWILNMPGLQETDSGDYKCVISNTHGEESFTYTVQVMASTTKPILVPPNPRNATVGYGESASFMCEVRSLTQPHIQWLKRMDGPVNPRVNNTIQVNGYHFIVLKAGQLLPRNDGSFLNKLTIEHATEGDAGMYICLGANPQGYNYRSAFLRVLPGKYYNPPDNYDTEQYGSFNADDIVVPQEVDSFWDSRALPIIIGVPAGIILIVIAITVCVIKRKQTRSDEPPRQSPNQVIRVQRYPPQQYPYGPAPTEKAFNHQYAALNHPQHYPKQDNTSQEPIVKTHSEKDSDVSIQQPLSHSSRTPPIPSLAPTPTLFQQHTHTHYYQRT